MRYAEIIVLKKSGGFDAPLTYSVPEELSSEIKTGSFARIPFRTGNMSGIVIGVSDSSNNIEDGKIKPVSSVINTIHLTEGQIKLARFISDYYHTSIARSLRLFLPKKIWNGNFNPPSELFYRTAETEKLTPKQKEIYESVSAAGGEVSETFFKSRDFSKGVINGMVKKGILIKISKPVFSAGPADFKTPEKTLTVKQNETINKIAEAKMPVLLYGVTGSGKTEIYLRRIIEAVKKGRQAILLVPEISLTPQTVDYFRGYFGDRIALFHSKMSDSARSDEWWRVKSGKAVLVIGSRSAIFAPVQNPGIVIMDEEHEWTYKQESAPYYETYRIAEQMAEMYGCELIFGSATPRAETYEKAERGEYVMVELNERFNNSELPKIHIVDLRDEFKKKNFSIFSLLLQNKLKERFAKKEQVILFVNQRGVANAVVCRDCGYTEKCPNCEISLKLHSNFTLVGSVAQSGAKAKPTILAPDRAWSQPSESQKLVCHYCGFTKAPNLLCPECRSPYIKNVGIGTQRVESEIKKMFPEVRVLRADSDTAKNGEDFPRIYRDFLEHKADILIGTQMIAKGMDFSKVSLIGIILADIGLHIPDFRSSERLFQILTQVAGRCGRGSEIGEVVLQTYNPENPTLKLAASYKYAEFIGNELKMRMKLGYPPYNRIIKFTVVGEDKKSVSDNIKKEQEILEDIFRVNSLDFKIVSAPSIIPKISNRYYYNVLIKSGNPSVIFSHWKPPKGWRIDIDPVHTV